MALEKEIESLIEKLSLIHFLITLALLDLTLELDEMDRPLHEVSIHQPPLLEVVFLVLVLEVPHLLVLRLDRLANADEPLQLRYLRLSIVLLELIQIHKELIEYDLILEETEILLSGLLEILHDRISKPVLLEGFDHHRLPQHRTHLLPTLVLIQALLLQNVRHSISNPCCHFEVALIGDSLREHLIDRLVVVLLLCRLHSPLDLELLDHIVDSVLEGVSVHLQLILQHQGLN